MNCAKMKTAGTIEIGTPILMVAIIGAMWVFLRWSDMSPLLKTVLSIADGILVILGLSLLGKPKGMAIRHFENQEKEGEQG